MSPEKKGRSAAAPRPFLRDGEKEEPLAPGVSVFTSREHTFGTDTFLLADFSMPGRGELCADFGTGCGTIPLLWCARAKPALVYAVEMQKSACDLAERSVRADGMEDKIRVVRGDIRMLRRTGALPYGLDRIACNPPYYPEKTGDRGFREGRALARHEYGGSFSDIAGAAAAFLRWGGRFFCCMRPDRLLEILFSLREAGLEPKFLRFVQQRRGSSPFLFLVRAVRGGKPGLEVGPVFFIEKEDGGFSEELKSVYGREKT